MLFDCLLTLDTVASLARVLKTPGNDINARDSNKRTCLMIAAALGKLEQAKLLLSNKVIPLFFVVFACAQLHLDGRLIRICLMDWAAALCCWRAAKVNRLLSFLL